VVAAPLPPAPVKPLVVPMSTADAAGGKGASAPVTTVKSSSTAASSTPPASAPPTAPAAKGDPFAGLDSLEAEMARLLGRDP
jgi:hypothetical protein